MIGVRRGECEFRDLAWLHFNMFKLSNLIGRIGLVPEGLELEPTHGAICIASEEVRTLFYFCFGTLQIGLSNCSGAPDTCWVPSSLPETRGGGEAQLVDHVRQSMMRYKFPAAH